MCQVDYENRFLLTISESLIHTEIKKKKNTFAPSSLLTWYLNAWIYIWIRFISIKRDILFIKKRKMFVFVTLQYKFLCVVIYLSNLNLSTRHLIKNKWKENTKGNSFYTRMTWKIEFMAVWRSSVVFHVILQLTKYWKSKTFETSEIYVERGRESLCHVDRFY